MFKRKSIILLLVTLLVSTLIGCGSKEVSEESVKSYVQGLVGEESKVTVTRIKKNNFEVHFTYDYEGVYMVHAMGTEESKEKFINICVNMVQAVENPMSSWFSGTQGVDATCKVYMDLTDSSMSEIAEFDDDKPYFMVDSSGIVKNSSGEIIDF